jgi:putative SOS response-associated peptidase YedK
MPVILSPEHFDAWLAPGDADTAAFLPLLIPYSAAEMIAVPANPIVNSPKSDCPECLQVA